MSKKNQKISFKKGENYNSKWKLEKQITSQSIPFALEEDCKYLFQENQCLSFSKDGQYCTVKSKNSTKEIDLIIIYQLPQWTEIQQIQFKGPNEEINCFFTADNQFAIFQIIVRCHLQDSFYIQNIVKNKGKEFTFLRSIILQYWTSLNNKLNLLFLRSDQLDQYQMDEDFNLKFIKCFQQPYRKNWINQILTYEGSNSKKLKIPITNQLNKFQTLGLHLNYIFFFVQKRKSFMSLIGSFKIIRQFPSNIKFLSLKNLYIYQLQNSKIYFYDFSRGQVVYTLNCISSDLQQYIKKLQIIGDHFAIKTDGDDFFGWKIK